MTYCLTTPVTPWTMPMPSVLVDWASAPGKSVGVRFFSRCRLRINFSSKLTVAMARPTLPVILLATTTDKHHSSVYVIRCITASSSCEKEKERTDQCPGHRRPTCQPSSALPSPGPTEIRRDLPPPLHMARRRGHERHYQCRVSARMDYPECPSPAQWCKFYKKQNTPVKTTTSTFVASKIKNQENNW